MQYSVFIATSLDGYIARLDGSIEWLDAATAEATDEDYGYEAFIESVDCLVMGRKTFEKVLTFGEWPYRIPVIVWSQTLRTIPVKVGSRAELHSGDLDSLVEKLESQSLERVYVDGGQTIQSFLEAQKLTDLTISQVPILLGEGIPLFESTPIEVPLELSESTAFPSGIVQSRYRILEIRDRKRPS